MTGSRMMPRRNASKSNFGVRLS